MTRVKGIWQSNTISFASKFKRYGLLSPPSSSMAVKCAPCLLTEKRVQAFKTRCLRKLLCIPCLEHKTNDWLRSKINSLVCPQEPLLATVKRWKLALFRHVTCHQSLSKTIPHGTLEGRRHCGWQRKCWMDNTKLEWTSLPMPELLTMASCRKQWKRICAESCHAH